MASDYEFEVSWQVGQIVTGETNVDPADNVTVGFVVQCQKCKPGYTAKRVRLVISLGMYEFEPLEVHSDDEKKELRSEARQYIGVQTSAGLVDNETDTIYEYTAGHFDRLPPDGAGFVDHEVVG